MIPKSTLSFSPFTTNKETQHAESHHRVETMLRSQCVDLGLKIAVAPAPLTGDVIKQYAIPNTVSQAWYIGRAIHRARKSKSNFIDAIVSVPYPLPSTGLRI